MKPNQLVKFLRRVGRRAAFVEASSAVCDGLVAVVYAVLAAVLLDAVAKLSPWGLTAVDALLLAVFLAALVQWIRRANAQRYDARRLARLAEERHGLNDSRLINAIDLAERRGAPGSDALASAAIAESERSVAELSAMRTVEATPALRSGARLLLPVLAFAICFALLPDAFRAALPRLLSPWGGLPPFSALKFDVKVTPDPAEQGDPATIEAQLTGPDLPETADAVFIEGDEVRRVPMANRGGGRFELPMERVERSSEFYIDTAEGRSERYRLEVSPPPEHEPQLARGGNGAATQPATSPAEGDDLRAEARRLARAAAEWRELMELTRGEQLSAELGEHAMAARERGEEEHASLAAELEAATAGVCENPGSGAAQTAFDQALENFRRSLGQPSPEGSLAQSGGRGQGNATGADDGAGPDGRGMGENPDPLPREAAGPADAGTRGERLDPGVTARGRADLEGVPAAYRAVTEAYFKRVAEEAE